MSIRCVPEVEHFPYDKNLKSSTVKFKISSTSKKTYKVLIKGGTEAFIDHIKIHKPILADFKVKEEAFTARSLNVANRRNIAILIVADPATWEEIDSLVEANRELAETVCTLQKDVVDYFKKLLSPPLAVKWQLNVEEEVVGVDYVSSTGTKPGFARGRDFASLFPPATSILLNSLLPTMQLSGVAAI